MQDDNCLLGPLTACHIVPESFFLELATRHAETTLRNLVHYIGLLRAFREVDIDLPSAFLMTGV